jgi:SAM-dependent methyltransferase
MKNKEALAFFQEMANNSHDPKSVKLAKSSDFSQMDADFILQYSDINSDILDLGSGTGLIINKIYDKVRHITAIEPFASFTQFIVLSDTIDIVNSTFDKYEITKTDFDLLTIFGVMHYFNERESIEIYSRFKSALKTGGKIIVKNQFGIDEDVIVEGYSEE